MTSESFINGVFDTISKCINRDLLSQKEHDPERATAYHEAGHAVLGLYHNIPPYHATIIPNQEEKTLGSVTPGYLKKTVTNAFGELIIEEAGDVEGYYLLF
jgi:hypothetical protein